MAPYNLAIGVALIGLATAQKPGTLPEVHPKITTYRCTLVDGQSTCTPKNNFLVLDALAHPVYQKDNPEYNCGSWGQPPNATACPTKEACAENCISELLHVKYFILHLQTCLRTIPISGAARASRCWVRCVRSIAYLRRHNCVLGLLVHTSADLATQ
jgi:hypothetical protein